MRPDPLSPLLMRDTYYTCAAKIGGAESGTKYGVVTVYSV